MRACIGMFCLLLAMSATAAQQHAVVLVYHHVSEDSPALTSVSPAVFDSHLQYLQQQDFNVWPLGRVLRALEGAEVIPDKTVAITFDDAYESVYSEAMPRLRARGWPFTLFVSSESIDRAYRQYLDWAQIRELIAAGAEVGNHSHSHAHLVRRIGDETEAQWHSRVSADIRRAADRIETETGLRPDLFAYPYGEYSPALKKLVAALGYRGLAQHSGAIGADSDRLALPRYPMSTGYADLDRFSTSVNSRPLPVIDAVAVKTGSIDARIDSLQLRLGEGEYRDRQLACYYASGSRLNLTRDPGDARVIRLEPGLKQPAGRNKINCTAPAADNSGAYYWYSFQWLVKKTDGSWYRE